MHHSKTFPEVFLKSEAKAFDIMSAEFPKMFSHVSGLDVRDLFIFKKG